MEIKKDNFGDFAFYSLKGNFDFNSIDFVISEIGGPTNQKIVLSLLVIAALFAGAVLPKLSSR